MTEPSRPSLGRACRRTLFAALAGGLAALVASAVPAEAAEATQRSARARRPTFRQTGIAAWYGAGFRGRRTAAGERFDPRAFTAAHPSLPFGARVRVTSHATGRSVVVRINDRGPRAPDRIIDLTEAAARRIGLWRRGLGRVTLERVG